MAALCRNAGRLLALAAILITLLLLYTDESVLNLLDMGGGEWMPSTMAGSERRSLASSPAPAPAHGNGLCPVHRSQCAVNESVIIDAIHNSTTIFQQFTCGFFDLHDDEKGEIASTCTIVSATVSLIGGLYMLFTYAFIPEMRSPQTQVVLQLAIANLISSIGSLLQADERDVFDPSNCCPTAMCYSQAIIGTFADLAAVYWSTCIAVQAYCQIVIVMHAKAMVQTYRIFYIVGWGLPTGLTIWALAGGYFGPAGAVCWIPSDLVWQQVVFYYLWVILCDVAIAYLITHIGFAVRGTKATGLTQRFMLYAAWSFFTTLGFIIQRAWQWANPCDIVAFGLTAWNAVVGPLQGFGFAVIYAINPGVWQGYKRHCSCNAEVNKSLKNYDANAIHQMIQTASGESVESEMSSILDLDYSDDDESL